MDIHTDRNCYFFQVWPSENALHGLPLVFGSKRALTGLFEPFYCYPSCLFCTSKTIDLPFRIFASCLMVGGQGPGVEVSGTWGVGCSPNPHELFHYNQQLQWHAHLSQLFIYFTSHCDHN